MENCLNSFKAFVSIVKVKPKTEKYCGVLVLSSAFGRMPIGHDSGHILVHNLQKYAQLCVIILLIDLLDKFLDSESIFLNKTKLY